MRGEIASALLPLRTPFGTQVFTVKDVSNPALRILWDIREPIFEQFLGVGILWDDAQSLNVLDRILYTW